jgi:type VI secretion system FHA domain protein
VALTLRVTSFHNQALGAQGIKTFGAAGGTIGRNQGNDWVLPDPERFVSGSHAMILCRNGVYYVQDLSTNGTFLNGSPQPIGNRREQALSEGDLLTIGEYQIAVSIDNAITGPTGFNTRAAQGVGHSGPAVATGPTGPPRGFDLQDLGGPTSADPLDFFADKSQPQARPITDPGVLPDHSPALDHSFQPPAFEHTPSGQFAAGGVIPEDWDKTGYGGRGTQAPRQAAAFANPPGAAPPAFGVPPAPAYPGAPPLGGFAAAPGAAPQPPPSGEQSGGVAALLMAAGLDAASAHAIAGTPGLATMLGTLFGVVVQGMLEVLKARAEIKSQFRVAVTSMRPVENNPLKFSANVAQALQNLLAPPNQAYLGPVEAVTEGFDDIKAHQIAMMAGIRAAFDSMLKRFDPEELAERFEKRMKRGALLALPGKGRYWDQYRDLYEELTQDADLNFQRLFGEKFAQAYEEQMRRLTAVRR